MNAPAFSERAKWNALKLSAVGRLALSLYPSHPLDGLYVVFTGYYDESETHGGSPFTIPGGLRRQSRTLGAI